MRKITIALITAAGLLAVPASADAAACRDAHGKFVKCPPAAAAKPAPKKVCRDAKGHFKKC